MKQKIICLLLLCCLSLYSSDIYSIGNSINLHNAQGNNVTKVVELKDTLQVQDVIHRVENFYKTYTTNVLSNPYSNDLIKKEYLTKRLIEKMDRVMLATGADPIIRAQDFTESAIRTLKVRHLRGDWYMVGYKWNARDDTDYQEIPLKVIQVNGQYFIDYITPEWNGALYGDTLLCYNMKSQPIDNRSSLLFLNTFYSAYIYEYCSIPENLIGRLADLRRKYFTSNALAQFKEAFNESKLDGYPNYDLLIDYFDFDCLWIPSITFTQLDEKIYQISYVKFNIPVIVVMEITEKDGEYKIDNIRIKK